MMTALTSSCLLCLACISVSRAAPHDEFCPDPEHRGSSGSFELTSNTCNAAQSARHLLQLASDRQTPPALPGEDATAHGVASASKLSDEDEDTSVPAKPGSGRVTGMSAMISFGRGITAAEEHTRHFEALVEPRLAGATEKEDTGYAMASSIGDVSSVFTLSSFTDASSSGSKAPHRRLLMIADKMQVARSVGITVVVLIIIISICVVLLAGFAGSRGDDDNSDVFSSDSEKFGSVAIAKRMSPKMPGRYGRSGAEPPRRVPANDKFSPAPSMRQQPMQHREMQEHPAPWSQDRFSPIPPARPMPSNAPPGRAGSPYAQQVQPYQRMPPGPPSHTQAPEQQIQQQPMQQQAPAPAPPSPPVAPPPDVAGGASARPPASSGSSSRHLCPGLVVPRGNECVLAVPTLRALNVPPRNTAAFFVRDLGGKPVIQAEILVQPWTSLGAGVGQRPIAVLRTAIAQGEEPATINDLSPLLAYVKASFEAGGRRSAYVYDARDEIFAHVAKDPFRSCYVLTSSRMGVQVIFTGTFPDHQVHVTNEARESLAEVEPCSTSFDPSGDYYKIRVVSHVDVGLILCGLLAIEHMEAS